MASTMRFDKWENPTGTLSLDIANATPGMTPIVPTSITISAGTASVTNTGLITFNTTSSTAGVSLNGCFTSAFKNYKIIFRAGGSSLGAAVYARFRKSGTDGSSASFYWSGSYSRSSGNIGSWNGSGSSVMDITRLHTNTTDQKATVVLDILGPANGQAPMYHFAWAGEDGTSPLGGNGNGTYAISDSFDGITFFTSAGTFTGTVQVYGYR